MELAIRKDQLHSVTSDRLRIFSSLGGCFGMPPILFSEIERFKLFFLFTQRISVHFRFETLKRSAFVGQICSLSV